MYKLILLLHLLQSPTQVRCLTEAIYFEGRSQSFAGQLKIGEVILTRSQSKDYDLCATVHNCSFSYWCDGRSERMREVKAKELAEQAAIYSIIRGPGEAFYYHSTKINPNWSSPYLYTIEDHKFYGK